MPRSFPRLALDAAKHHVCRTISSADLWVPGRFDGEWQRCLLLPRGSAEAARPRPLPRWTNGHRRFERCGPGSVFTFLSALRGSSGVAAAASTAAAAFTGGSSARICGTTGTTGRSGWNGTDVSTDAGTYYSRAWNNLEGTSILGARVFEAPPRRRGDTSSEVPEMAPPDYSGP